MIQVRILQLVNLFVLMKQATSVTLEEAAASILNENIDVAEAEHNEVHGDMLAEATDAVTMEAGQQISEVTEVSEVCTIKN